MNNEFGWEFWADSELVHIDEDYRIFRKNGYLCYCDAGVNPGDADSRIRREPKFISTTTELAD